MHRQLVSRLSLIFIAGFLFAEGHQNWVRGKISVHTEVLALIFAAYGLAFSLLVISGCRTWMPKGSDFIALLGAVFAIVTSIYIMSVVDFAGAYRTDSLAFSHYAAQLCLRGQNPYSTELHNALSMFSVDPEFITVTTNGDIISSMNYPALHFLVFVPAVALGIADMRVILLLFELALAFLIFRRAPIGLKGIALVPFLAGSDLAIGFTSGCVTDYLWVLPCALAAMNLENPKRSGLWYGVACAVKQVPWVAFPFLMIWRWKTAPKQFRFNHLKDFLSWTSLAFIVPNLPFIVWDWRSWLSGLITPITGGLIFLSRGLSAISQMELVSFPPSFYLICCVAVLLTLVFNYFCYFDSIKGSLWILPGVVLWFSYRALQNYFIYWIPLLEISVLKALPEQVAREVT